MPSSLLCESCKRKIEFVEAQYCPACHKSSVLGLSSHGCTGRSAIDRLYSVCWYRGPSVSLINAFKYGHHVTTLTSVLTDLMYPSISEELWYAWEHAVFIPVPLHKQKLAKRGFNQSEYIARILAKIFEGTVEASLLFRARNTISQTLCDTRQRRTNVDGAFDVSASRLIDSHVTHVLVDDVVTTGSTLEACARVLRAHGAITRLEAFTVARG